MNYFEIAHVLNFMVANDVCDISLNLTGRCCHIHLSLILPRVCTLLQCLSNIVVSYNNFQGDSYLILLVVLQPPSLP